MDAIFKITLKMVKFKFHEIYGFVSDIKLSWSLGCRDQKIF